MSTLTLLSPTTSASVAGDPSLVLTTDNYDNVVAMASGLAGAEVVTIQIATPGGLIQYSEAGAAANLTATQPHRFLPCGPTYVFSKAATVGAVGIFAALDASI